MYNLSILTESKLIFLRLIPELKSKYVTESTNIMNIKKLTILKYILEILLIMSVSFIYYLNQPVMSKKIIYIPNGSINKIISHLRANNYDLSKLDSLYLRVIGSPQSGWIDIGQSRLTRADFLYKLTSAKAALRNVTLIPGETTYIFLNQLSSNLNLDRVKLQYFYEKYTPIKEGAFVPDTYKVPVGIDEKTLIKL